MAKILSNIQEAVDMIVGQEVLGVEFDLPEGAERNGKGGTVVVYIAGLRLYADNPEVCSDDSGDAVAAF